MTLKSKILSPYRKVASWLKSSRIKQLEEHLFSTVNEVNRMSIMLNLIIGSIEKEEKARKEQISFIKVGIKKELNKCIKEYKETQEQSFIVGLEQRVSTIVEDLESSIRSKGDHLTDIMSGCRKVITELNMAENDFLEVKILGDKAKREYHVYIDQLKKEFLDNYDELLNRVLTFKETDAATRRLASIEERCTLLELKVK